MKIIFLALLLSSSLAFAKANTGIASAPTGGVVYYGGPVISNVKVHLVFWGAGIPADVQQPLGAFYKAIVNSDYVDQLAEYKTTGSAVDGNSGTNQTIGRGTMGDTVTITPANTSKQLTQADVEKELEYQVSTGALPKPDDNSLYMIYYPTGYNINISFGASCVVWGADHEVYKSPKFGNLYYAMFPCYIDVSQLSTLTMASSHEFAEAITDPVSPLANETVARPAAWLDSSESEIGDLCAWKPTTLTAGTQTYTVQQEWLNSLSGCNTATFTSK